MSINENIINGLSVDVEDYFHVSNFAGQISYDEWDSFELRVEQNTQRLLDLFGRYSVRATFFILGWVAKRCPNLVRRIAQCGHEIACHSDKHRLVYDLTDDEFRNDLLESKQVLEKLSGQKIVGFRAPSYSITRKNIHALDILHECGFTYDSSIFPIHHHRYGIPDFNRFPTGIKLQNGNVINEYPISTIRMGAKNFPIGGGAYARILPAWLLIKWLRKINRQERKPFVFYLHPWEIDPAQPRLPCSRFTRFRHYVNLDKMEKKLEKILKRFSFAPLKEIEIAETTLDIKNLGRENS